MPTAVAIAWNILQGDVHWVINVNGSMVQLLLHMMWGAPLITSGAESLGHGILFFL